MGAGRTVSIGVLERLDLRGVTDPAELGRRLPRPAADGERPVAAVRAILADVRERGDAAVRELTERFDGVDLDELRVPAGELKRGARRDPVPSSGRAWRPPRRHHRGLPPGRGRARRRLPPRRRPGSASARCAARSTGPAATCPGGRAAYPSTVLMTAVPARVAGVAEVVLCVPPDRRRPACRRSMLAAAAIAGVDEVYRIGGAQAIAAMAYGTESIPPVDVIVGPGNVYVALAKREVAADGLVGVPAAFAGPVRGRGRRRRRRRRPTWAAIDVVVQAEHGPDGLAWLVTWSPRRSPTRSTPRSTGIVGRRPARAEIESTLAAGGYAVLVDGPEQAMAVANLIAPEHLQLMTADPEALVPLVRHAGAVFCGPWAPASVGDYVAGPSHVLPTFGSARFAGALTVDDFTKPVHVVVGRPRRARRGSAPHVAALARAEGLDAHAESVRLRRA